MDEIDGQSSSSSDDDYVPELESEDNGTATDDDVDDSVTDKECRYSKRKKQAEKKSPARKKRSDALRLDDDDDEDVKKEGSELDKTVEGSVFGNDEEDSKKRADDLWSSFKKDVDSITTTTCRKADLQENELDSTWGPMTSPLPTSSPENTEQITVTKVYDFAGEEVRVTEKPNTPLAPSAKKVIMTPNQLTSTPLTSPAEPLASGTKKLAGLGSVLNRLGAKKKLSTLEKSRLDWNQFKHDEGIVEELNTFNKGKEGYLEKQAFLHRADMRQFEIERNLRMTDQSNR